MIKVTKEILENIGIENLFLSGKKEREKWLLHPIEMEYSYWVCSLDTPCFLANVICNIKINDEYIRIPSTIELLEENIYRLEFTDNSSRDFDIIKRKKRENHDKNLQLGNAWNGRYRK